VTAGDHPGNVTVTTGCGLGGAASGRPFKFTGKFVAVASTPFPCLEPLHWQLSNGPGPGTLTSSAETTTAQSSARAEFSPGAVPVPGAGRSWEPHPRLSIARAHPQPPTGRATEQCPHASLVVPLDLLGKARLQVRRRCRPRRLVLSELLCRVLELRWPACAPPCAAASRAAAAACRPRHAATCAASRAPRARGPWTWCARTVATSAIRN